ncbi:heparinase II/III family protein [bacterium]|nr:heparinase II/III family protein [bacterium]
MKKILIVFCIVIAAALAVSAHAAPSSSDRLPIPTGPGAKCERLDGNLEKLAWDSEGVLVWEAPIGDRVMFSFPLPQGAKFADYGLGKFDLKIEGGPADVMVFIEQPGQKRRVYRPVDIIAPHEGWETIHLDLSQPEIVRETFYEADAPRITFNLWAVKSGYSEEAPTRQISIRNVRLVKRYLDVRWNGRDYESKTGPDGELVFTYPIVVANRDSKSRTVASRLDHWKGRLCSGTISPATATIAPGDSALFTATLRLPADRARTLPALYCEWFLPVFSVNGASDSEEGILRSSDRITLPLIIMPKQMRNPVILFGPEDIRGIMERYRTTDWGKREGDGYIAQADKMLQGGLTIPDGPGWTAAYYFCVEHRTPLVHEGPGRHRCPIGGEYLTTDFMGVDLDLDYRTNEHAAMFTGAKNLALAYLLTGDKRYSEGALTIIRQYRDKYFTWPWLDLDASNETIDKGRVQFSKYMEAMYMINLTEAYDILKGTGGVSPEEGRDLEWNFLIPISVEMTDYRMNMQHRQQAITANAIATGLCCGHAPLVAFAVAGDKNYLNLRRYLSTGDGIPNEHGYNNDMGRQFFITAMLFRDGIDTYDDMLRRLLWGGLWWSVPFNPRQYGDVYLDASKHFPDPLYRMLASRDLLDGEAPPLNGARVDFGTPPSVNFPNSGLSILRRPFENGTMDAEFKWGIPDNRGSFSVLSLGLFFGGYNCQSYPGHFPWGSTDLHHEWQIQSASHSTIVVDRRNQSGMKDYFKDHYMPHASRQLSFEDGSDAASTVVFNDRIYPGVKIWRAVCVLDGAYLVLDLLRSDSEHVYDRWFHGVPDKSNGLAGIHLDMKPHPEPLGSADGYEMVQNLSSAVTGGDFGCDWLLSGKGTKDELHLAMRVLNTAPVEAIHGFEFSRQYRGPEKEFLLLSRKARNADFIVLFEPNRGESKLSRYERFDVPDEKGAKVAGATGVRLTLAGKTYEVILNPDEAAVKTVGGVTRKVLSVGVER